MSLQWLKQFVKVFASQADGSFPGDAKSGELSISYVSTDRLNMNTEVRRRLFRCDVGAAGRCRRSRGARAHSRHTGQGGSPRGTFNSVVAPEGVHYAAIYFRDAHQDMRDRHRVRVDRCQSSSGVKQYHRLVAVGRPGGFLIRGLAPTHAE